MDAVQRILDLIDKHNITAAQLQRDAKLSPSSIAQWKKGKSNPSYGALTMRKWIVGMFVTILFAIAALAATFIVAFFG